MIEHLPGDVSTVFVVTALGQDKRQACVSVDLSAQVGGIGGAHGLLGIAPRGTKVTEPA